MSLRPSPPFFIWHTAEDIYVPPEHTYRLAAALAANGVAHAVHVFATGRTASGSRDGAGDAATWTTLAASWIAEQADVPAHLEPDVTSTRWRLEHDNRLGRRPDDAPTRPA